MDHHRRPSEQSLMTVRKWLLESGDGLSTANHTPPLKFNENKKKKSFSKKIILRKNDDTGKSYPKRSSIVDWIYDFIKSVFTSYENNPDKSNEANSPRKTCFSDQFDDVNTETNLNNCNQSSTSIYPLYCFSLKDGQIIPVNFPSRLSSTRIPYIQSSNSNPSTIAPKSSSISKTISLQTTQNFIDNHLIANAPEIIFAESTCQLIKQTWLS